MLLNEKKTLVQILTKFQSLLYKGNKKPAPITYARSKYVIIIVINDNNK